MTSTQIKQGASTWHALLRTDISQYGMPQVVSVAPKDPNFPYTLHTWSSPAIPRKYAGHYIVLNGWYGTWDGTANSSVGYNDSAFGASGTPDVDPAYNLWQMILKTNSGKSGVYVGW